MHPTKTLESVISGIFTAELLQRFMIHSVSRSNRLVSFEVDCGRTSVEITPADRREQSGPKFFDHEIFVESTVFRRSNSDRTCLAQLNAHAPLCITTTCKNSIALFSRIPCFTEDGFRDVALDVAIRAVKDHILWRRFLMRSDVTTEVVENYFKKTPPIEWSTTNSHCSALEQWISGMGFAVSSRDHAGISFGLPSEDFGMRCERELRL